MLSRRGGFCWLARQKACMGRGRWLTWGVYKTVNTVCEGFRSKIRFKSICLYLARTGFTPFYYSDWRWSIICKKYCAFQESFTCGLLSSSPLIFCRLAPWAFPSLSLSLLSSLPGPLLPRPAGWLAVKIHYSMITTIVPQVWLRPGMEEEEGYVCERIIVRPEEEEAALFPARGTRHLSISDWPSRRAQAAMIRPETRIIPPFNISQDGNITRLQSIWEGHACTHPVQGRGIMAGSYFMASYNTVNVVASSYFMASCNTEWWWVFRGKQ